MTVVGYCIYNPQTDEFSTGGRRPHMSKTQKKVWSKIGHLKAHLTQANISDRYIGAKIYEVTLGKSVPFSELDKKHKLKILKGYQQ